MIFLKNKTSKALFLIMCALVLSGVVISYLYYNNVNKSTDPRIVQARILYEKYNGYAQIGAYESIFSLMDSIESIYSSIDHYKNSYEIGVLYNNRSASFLTQSFYSEKMELKDQDSLIVLAENAANKSIEIYHQWLQVFEDKNKEDIEKIISGEFYDGLEHYTATQKNNYSKNRIKEIQESQTETKRRLSVSYTNLGIIYRHKLQYEAAANCYKTAIDLWDRNLTAENNLNVLLGRPIKKRSFIQKMFPPERDQN
jgi:tetratricopeptide (TPR) repeat protein